MPRAASSWQELAIANMRLVAETAERMKGSLPAVVETDEMISAGYLGLCDAAQRYDSSKRCSFRTYATKRIWGAIMDWLRSLDHIPRLARLRARQSQSTHTLPGVISIDAPCDSRDDNHSPDHAAYAALLRARNGCPIRYASNKEWPAVFHGLSENERAVIDLKYRQDFTFKQISLRLQVSESRICQIHKQALRRWREWLEQKRKTD